MGFMSTKVIRAFAAAVPDFRSIPAAFSAVFSVGDEFVFPSGDTIDAEWFNRLVEEGDITPVDPQPLRESYCIYLPEGDAAPEYISMKETAARFKAFADEQTLHGDDLFGRGDKDGALTHYGRAAAAAQHPDYYEKMLLCPMSERRRERIEKMLSESKVR